VLLVVAAACAGCGGSGKAQTVLETKRTIVALALHGNDAAWLAGGHGARCPVSLWLRSSGRTSVLPLPRSVSAARVDDCSVFGSYGFAAVALAGTDVAWIVDEPHEYVGVVSEGASSATPRMTSTLVRATTGGGIVSPVGASVGGIAATGAGVLWGTAHIAYRQTLVDDGTCDLDLARVGCRTRVDGGGVFTWTRGVSTRVPGLPPSAALASAGNLLAVAARPRSRWIHGEARLASVQVRDPRGRVVTRVTAPQEIDGLALSQQILAVGDGLTSTVSVYAVPSGRFLRAVPVSLDPSTRIAAVGRRLVVWDPQHVITVDAFTGRRRTIVGFASPTRSAMGFYWTVTAVAVDGNRLAWAQTTPGGISVVKAVDAG
jgi:hypothetical protein